MSNQKGFILPITLSIVFVLFSFLTFQLNYYLIEKDLFESKNEVFRTQRLLQSAMVDVKEILKEEGNLHSSGVFFYESGYVVYSVSPANGNASFVTIKATTKDGIAKQLKYYYYHEEETVMPWLEER